MAGESENKQMTELLRVDRVKVSRGGSVILNDVSWTVSGSERWVIMGANGSGKTSLLGVLTGLMIPTSGNVTMLGRTFGEHDWSVLKKQVSLVSSSVRQMVNEDELALEVIASGLFGQINYWGRLKPDEVAIAKKVGATVGCGKILLRPWAVLSQGERQRVLIGRALIANPKLLILDEPCAGLDPAAREQFVHFLDGLARKKGGPGLVLVTHHVEEITPGFSHVLGLREGRVTASGPATEVLTSEILSKLFNAPVQVHFNEGRYTLDVHARSRRAI